MTVVTRQTTELIAASPAECVNDAELERVLADEVNLLQAPGDHPIKAVARQGDLPAAGTIDLLCVDESGLPVAVEVKLARNAEARREVPLVRDQLPKALERMWEPSPIAAAARNRFREILLQRCLVRAGESASVGRGTDVRVLTIKERAPNEGCS